MDDDVITLHGGQQFVCVKSFWYPDEATLASTALSSTGIVNYLQNDRILTCVWAWNVALGGIRLMVPMESAETAIAALGSIEPESADRVSRDDLDQITVERGARRRFASRMLLGLCILLSPAINSLTILLVQRFSVQ